MDKLREKGLGTFRERYQRTLDQTETPELLDRKLRAIEQYRKEMEGQMRRKKVLTQKALRQKAEGKSDDDDAAHRTNPRDVLLQSQPPAASPATADTRLPG